MYTMQLQKALWYMLLLTCTGSRTAIAFSSSNSAAAASATTRAICTTTEQPLQPVGNILILDHLNINHEKGRLDWLKAFYFDFLNLVVDPRKEANLAAGRKTVWANIGANQFHLPEGKPDAQVLDGLITLSYPSFSTIQDRVEEAREKLAGSQFDVVLEGHDDSSKNEADTFSSLASPSVAMRVTDPWGTCFRLVQGLAEERDTRGRQPGPCESEGFAMRDLTVYTAPGCNIPGIARFYQQIMGAPILDQSSNHCIVSVGPRQTLSFRVHPAGKATVRHEDLRDETENGHAAPSLEGNEFFSSNYGPHVSMYVADFPGCYQKVQNLGISYVNPRFKRRAYTLEQAIDDCMFRVLDIKDPAAPADGAILRLEHEIRSVVNRDGSMYKSCPFDEMPGS